MFSRLFWFAAMLTLTGAAPRGETVLWQAKPVIEAGRVVAMDYRLSFTGDSDGETELQLPNDWAGERELYKAVRNLKAEGGTLSAGAEPHLRMLKHTPGAPVTLTYRLVSDADAPPPKAGGNDYRARFADGLTFIIGYTALIQPAHLTAAAPSRFVFEAVEGAPLFVSDLVKTKATRMDFSDLAASVLMGGDIRIIDAGGSQRLALHGQFDAISDEALKRAFVSVSEDQRAYWKAGQTPYLVTAIIEKGAEGTSSLGGTGLDDAFALFSTANMDRAETLPILAHEMMHSWVPGQIGAMPEENEATDYWLSEGFTDWATLRALVRAGEWTPEDFAAWFNEALAAHDMSPHVNATAAEAAAGFWSNPDLGKLPYRRGMLIASQLDADVRRATKGKRDLDNVLLAMKRAAKKDPDKHAAQHLIAALKKTGKVDAADFIARAAVKGEGVDLPGNLYAPCGQIETAMRAVWERGFDFEATAANDWKIRGVTPGSSAYMAGLRDGMALAAWSEDSRARDATKPVTALVHENKSVRAITWLPASKETRPVRALVLDKAMSADTRAACVKRLAGR